MSVGEYHLLIPKYHPYYKITFLLIMQKTKVVQLIAKYTDRYNILQKMKN
jgi:hypothetical protein